jgi:Xaa-Pro dipeptidase
MAASEKEIKRRLEAIRGKMRQEGLQALIFFSQVQTGYAASCRYISNYHLTTRKEYLLLPLSGEPVLIVPTIGQQHWAKTSTWIKDVRSGGEAEGMIREMVRTLNAIGLGKASIGIVGMINIMPQHDYSLLVKDLPAAVFKDATDLLDSVRMVKSAEEIEMIRETTDIADATYKKLLEILRPGIDEREIMAEVGKLMALRGVEDVLILTAKGASFPGFINHPGRYTFQAGDHYVWSVEISGPSGYWSQIIRPLYLQKTTDRQRALYEVARAAMEAGAEKLKPGTRIGDLVGAVAETVKKGGFKTGLWCGHGMGMDVGEAPPLFIDSTLPLEEGMVITIHPHVMTLDGQAGMFVGDTFVVRKNGAENLSHTAPDFKCVKR